MTSAGTRSCVVWTSCEAELIRPSTAAVEKPAEVTKGGWIHESQQGFPPFQCLGQFRGGQPLQRMQIVRQAQGKQRLPLTPLILQLPTVVRSDLGKGLDAQMGGEILLPGLGQWIQPRHALAVGHEGSVRPAGGVITGRLKGVIDHQQSAVGHR